jgi:uncharacterized membrane protein
MKNKIKAAMSAATVAALTIPALASAQLDVTAGGGTGLPGGSILNIVTNIMNWLLLVIGILGVIGFIIAGILYLTSAGDETAIERAKKAMLYSIIGVIVALLGVVILQAAKSLLGGTGANF